MISRKKIRVSLLILGAIVTSCKMFNGVYQKNRISDHQDKPDLVSYYGFLDSTNPNDGLPSTCDCDYIKIGLYLMQDSSFVLKRQKGRLKILSLDQKYGTWKIDAPKTLQLKIDSTVRSSIFRTVREHFSPAQILRMEMSDNKLIGYDGKILTTSGKRIDAKREN